MSKIFMKTLTLGAIVAIGFATIIGGFCVWMLIQFPSDKDIKGCITTKLYKVTLCPSAPTYTRISKISENIQKAVILTEDSAFFTHHGFDFQEMENSLKQNMEKGKFARGGSTITQQLAKNLFLSREKTLQRKILEALITMRIEKVLSKREILERYLNVVQFGKDIYGVKAAAEFYFKKSATDLSVVESAFLAFLLPSPEKYSKSFFQGKMTPFAKKRVTQIVDRLYDYKRISEDQYLAARTDLDQFLVGEKKESDLDFDSIEEEKIDPEVEDI